MNEDLSEFQRHIAFLGFVVLVCFAAFIYLAVSLVDVLLPLMWSAFFAVPLTALIFRISTGTVRCCNVIGSCLDDGYDPDKAVTFWILPTKNRIYLDDSPEIQAILERVHNPCVVCCRGCCFCGLTGNLTPWCQRRVRINKLSVGMETSNASKVNRLVEGWTYYVRIPRTDDPASSLFEESVAADSLEARPTGAVQLELFLDMDGRYPAVIDTSQADDNVAVTGTLQLDDTSTMAWIFAFLVSMVILGLGVYLFIFCISLGIKSLQENSDAYAKGAQDAIALVSGTLTHILPEDTLKNMESQATNIATTALPSVATKVASHFEYIGFQIFLFVIYVFFWIFEPFPINSTVAQVIQNYLFLKTCVCLLTAVLITLLLWCLHCQLWNIFFVVTFLLSYIPEIGTIAAFALMIPAILLDGNISMEQRQKNTLLLIIFGALIKIIVSNIIEVRLYSALGGQYMRMHPVVVLLIMMLFQSLFGLTGMFLAIPIIAALKYVLLSLEMPAVYLNPVLTVMEGDEAGPHKNFVDKHRENYGSMQEEGSKDASKRARQEAYNEAEQRQSDAKDTVQDA